MLISNDNESNNDSNNTNPNNNNKYTKSVITLLEIV